MYSWYMMFIIVKWCIMMYYGIFFGVPMLNVIREHIHHSEKKNTIKSPYIIIPGWWFQTVLFSIIYVIILHMTFIFFKMVKTTSHTFHTLYPLQLYLLPVGSLVPPVGSLTPALLALQVGLLLDFWSPVRVGQTWKARSPWSSLRDCWVMRCVSGPGKPTRPTFYRGWYGKSQPFMMPGCFMFDETGPTWFCLTMFLQNSLIFSTWVCPSTHFAWQLRFIRQLCRAIATLH